MFTCTHANYVTTTDSRFLSSLHSNGTLASAKRVCSATSQRTVPPPLPSAPAAHYPSPPLPTELSGADSGASAGSSAGAGSDTDGERAGAGDEHRVHIQQV